MSWFSRAPKYPEYPNESDYDMDSQLGFRLYNEAIAKYNTEMAIYDKYMEENQHRRGGRRSRRRKTTGRRRRRRTGRRRR
jgi:hypothetical protein